MNPIFVYILMFLSLWTVAFTILAKNIRGDASNRWIGISLFVGGCASFAFSIHATIIPFLDRHDALTPTLQRALELVSIPAFWLYWHGLGYFMLVSALLYSRLLRPPAARIAAILLAVPPAAVFVRTADFTLPFELELSDVRLVNGLYVGAAILLFFGGIRLEKDARKRKNLVRTAVVLSTAILWAYVNDFLGMIRFSFGNRHFTLESNGMWEYNYLIIFWLVACFLYYGLKYGFLGVKLRVEEQKFEDSMRNLTHGTQILNHSIKNEVQKIHYLAGRAQTFLKDNRSDKVELSLTGIGQVADHLLDMIDRIKGKAGEVELKESKESLVELIDSVLGAVRPLHPGQVSVTKDYAADGLLLCDRSHIREVLGNLFMNAFEAMPRENGRLHVRTEYKKRKLRITITDNGCGIDKDNLPRVFAPFFSTKKDSLSYGLGLSYCYSVIGKHGGKIYVEWSEPGQGTSMRIEFPAARFEPAATAASVPFVVH
ncbi:sensor histidine kinase [Cohnella sp. CFH 77786]|uniref:sensor histidine kinase n=1 Tax=Cohnella sp. CFH 77786 TaxID=2662265 RepID=UPI001C609FE6|nr:HAMP domain-containing sensor histidine kinase [Cohnella sp. CFH 77786]